MGVGGTPGESPCRSGWVTSMVERYGAKYVVVAMFRDIRECLRRVVSVEILRVIALWCELSLGGHVGAKLVRKCPWLRMVGGVR